MNAGGELSNQIAVNPRLRFGMLEQTAVSGSDRTVKEEVMSRMAAYQSAKLALEAAEAACVAGTECELEALDKATSDFEAVGGYTVYAILQLPLSATPEALPACTPACVLVMASGSRGGGAD